MKAKTNKAKTETKSKKVKSPKTPKKEKFVVKGEELLKKIKEIVKEGNVRKITITGKKGNEIMSFPLTVGVVGTLLAPMWAAVGAIAALITECTITVERR